MTFFPQLIAGPIVHHKEMMPQFSDGSKRNHAEDFAVGASIFALGLGKKVLLADPMALTRVLSLRRPYRAKLPLDICVVGIICFSLQIYFDFSGYSDMAIGLARLFGIRLPLNFASPYKAKSIVEFWRRWHMTLSRFLRDYLYFSFGGNRRGPVRRHINLMLTMLLGGLWHGAGMDLCGLGRLAWLLSRCQSSLVETKKRFFNPGFGLSLGLSLFDFLCSLDRLGFLPC